MGALAQFKTASLLTAITGFRLDGVLKTTDAATGVSRTFSPDGFIAPGVARWVDRSGGISVGYPTITASLRRPSKTNRAYKAIVKVTLPTLAALGTSTATGILPMAQKAYDHFSVTEFVMPEQGLLWERQALLDVTHSLYATTITASDGVPTDATASPLMAMVENFDAPWG